MIWLVFQDFSDEDASESSNEDDEDSPKVWDCSSWPLMLSLLIIFMISWNCIFNPFWHMQCAKDKNRPAEKTLKTPPEKKAKMTTPSKGKNTDEKCYLLTCLHCCSFPCHINLTFWSTFMQAVVLVWEVAMSMSPPLIHPSWWRRRLQSLRGLSNLLDMPATRAAGKFSALLFEPVSIWFCHMISFYSRMCCNIYWHTSFSSYPGLSIPT